MARLGINSQNVHPAHYDANGNVLIGLPTLSTGDTYASEQAYAALKAENERLRAERDMVVRVFADCLDETCAALLPMRTDEQSWGYATYGMIRQILAWNDELKALGSVDG